jgi:hypothetical protein
VSTRKIKKVLQWHLGWGRSSWPNPMKRRIGFFPRADRGCQQNRGASAQAHGVPTRTTIYFFNVLHRGFRGDMQNPTTPQWGKTKETESFYVVQKQIAEIMSVAVTGKAAEHRRTPRALRARCYFGASEATIASNRGSSRSGSQSGLRRKWP